jgi:hypothetical protein
MGNRKATAVNKGFKAVKCAIAIGAYFESALNLRYFEGYKNLISQPVEVQRLQ